MVFLGSPGPSVESSLVAATGTPPHLSPALFLCLWFSTYSDPNSYIMPSDKWKAISEFAVLTTIFHILFGFVHKLPLILLLLFYLGHWWIECRRTPLFWHLAPNKNDPKQLLCPFLVLRLYHQDVPGPGGTFVWDETVSHTSTLTFYYCLVQKYQTIILIYLFF